ncbi:2-succinylbenzoate--CoA ligase [Umezakia ovalisporum]|jgi:O-succinylbenzoic acid--CoA ligase|uniref:2-succinylbenzoate--CoA ligase n=2 Tax=Umezakia ovalisporum TaxID=75695 RepID=A0AA43GWC3_9CYAN|nr:2-succinylbenzoate--CoA ligase [Umezakia ovalisporum]MBI1243031.1 AMP-binding protein [Nostoc sp. RI_552]MDH6055693.1 2-succinylbenzoate--CoA ligase [Umezakia ovalisporum FSS-43]MDH6062357.1 2-succinylbenzoate--CoA ligase [Umezakia ovalisporum FSS-62]MDH6068234.1 2-succinylbenzoate--CoA ligase [Umezakia ovalisporum APH033B]MDH6069364.1 2-succinylbenzoate--CoA ligase [Umezakia ovalisporum CobakiLakeA]
MSIEQPIVYLHKLAASDFIIGDHNHQFQHIASQLYLELKQKLAFGNIPKIIIAEREPVRFLAGFIAACAASCPIFLCNPDWKKQEWQQVLELVQPDIIWGLGEQEIKISNHYLPSPQSLIMIPTGGSSGKIKFAMHTWETLIASVGGFTEYFQVKAVNSFCVLPLYHVSGLMQFMRSFTTGGKLAVVPFKDLVSSQEYHIETANFFISLVPTQLQRLLEKPELTEWLCLFKTVLLGGGPGWYELLAKARFHCIRLAPTYGMTETASQIAALKPDDFLNGKINSGQILPHAQVNIRNQQGEILNSNQTGNITIQGQSLALGYYPQTWKNENYLQVDDLGFLDSQGYLNIVGRSSDKIITGGENIYPTEIEAAIRSTEMVIDVCVIGLPDQQWGEAVTAIYVPKHPQNCHLKLQAELKEKLSKFKIPKRWISVTKLPRNSQGKINRQQLQKIATEYLQNLS